MDAIPYAAPHANLAHALEQVCRSHEPLVITRDDGPSIVLLSLEQFRALEETAHLLHSPAKAVRLLQARDQLSR